jgi:hypothetical protein
VVRPLDNVRKARVRLCRLIYRKLGWIHHSEGGESVARGKGMAAVYPVHGSVLFLSRSLSHAHGID